MKKWFSNKENLVAVTVLKIIGIVIGFLAIIIVARVYLSTFGFYHSRPLYEEYLHSLEEYAPAEELIHRYMPYEYVSPAS